MSQPILNPNTCYVLVNHQNPEPLNEENFHQAYDFNNQPGAWKFVGIRPTPKEDQVEEEERIQYTRVCRIADYPLAVLELLKKNREGSEKELERCIKQLKKVGINSFSDLSLKTICDNHEEVFDFAETLQALCRKNSYYESPVNVVDLTHPAGERLSIFEIERKIAENDFPEGWHLVEVFIDFFNN